MSKATSHEELLLPPRRLLPAPPDDPVDYYYRPLTARLYQRRLALALELLGVGPFASLLEVDYGSGILLPELARRTRRLVAIDLHGAEPEVRRMLDELSLDGELVHADLYDLPFGDGEFDAVLCLSVLEHLKDRAPALGELARVVRFGGTAVLGFPGRNPATDSFFRLVGYDPRELHPPGHRDILAAAEAEARFVVERRAHLPRVLPVSLSAYVVARCRRV